MATGLHIHRQVDRCSHKILSLETILVCSDNTKCGLEVKLENIHIGRTRKASDRQGERVSHDYNIMSRKIKPYNVHIALLLVSNHSFLIYTPFIFFFDYPIKKCLALTIPQKDNKLENYRNFNS